jgi:hypothetical protein
MDKYPVTRDKATPCQVVTTLSVTRPHLTILETMSYQTTGGTYDDRTNPWQDCLIIMHLIFP